MSLSQELKSDCLNEDVLQSPSSYACFSFSLFHSSSPNSFSHSTLFSSLTLTNQERQLSRTVFQRGVLLRTRLRLCQRLVGQILDRKHRRRWTEGQGRQRHHTRLSPPLLHPSGAPSDRRRARSTWCSKRPALRTSGHVSSTVLTGTSGLKKTPPPKQRKQMSVIKVSSKSGSATRGAQKTIRVELQGGTPTHDIISSIIP